MQLTTALAALAATLVAAHPGHDHSAEQAVRREFLQHHSRGLDHCAEKLALRGVTERSSLRRHEAAEKLREKRGLKSEFC